MNYPQAAYEIEAKLIKCYEVFAIKIFGNMEHFRKIDASVPRWVAEAGISSDSPVGRSKFQQLYEGSSNHEELNQILYYYDCDNLISSLQNVINESFHLSDRIDRALAEEVRYNATVDEHLKEYSGHRFLSGEIVVPLFSLTNMLFVNLYSQLDYITKLFFEIRNAYTDFSAYRKMRSNGILYGDKGKLNISNIQDTIFDSSHSTVKTIINFRNEIVHNGTLDSRQKLFQKYEEGKIVEQFILLPDTTDGNLDKHKGRSHFYGRENKWSNTIPALLEDHYGKLLSTLKVLLNEEATDEIEFSGPEMKILEDMLKDKVDDSVKPEEMTTKEWEIFKKKFNFS